MKEACHPALQTFSTFKIKLDLLSFLFRFRFHKREEETFGVLSANMLTVAGVNSYMGGV